MPDVEVQVISSTNRKRERVVCKLTAAIILRHAVLGLPGSLSMAGRGDGVIL